MKFYISCIFFKNKMSNIIERLSGASNAETMRILYGNDGNGDALTQEEIMNYIKNVKDNTFLIWQLIPYVESENILKLIVFLDNVKPHVLNELNNLYDDNISGFIKRRLTYVNVDQAMDILFNLKTDTYITMVLCKILEDGFSIVNFLRDNVQKMNNDFLNTYFEFYFSWYRSKMEPKGVMAYLIGTLYDMCIRRKYRMYKDILTNQLINRFDVLAFISENVDEILKDLEGDVDKILKYFYKYVVLREVVIFESKVRFLQGQSNEKERIQIIDSIDNGSDIFSIVNNNIDMVKNETS